MPKLPHDEPAPKRVRSHRSRASSARITIDQYNAMFKAYLETPNLSAAARAAGVAVGTAKIYIDGPARPEAGLEPIKARCARVHAAAHEAEELTLMKFRQEQVRSLQESLRTSDLEMAIHRKLMLDRAEALKQGLPADPGSSFAAAANTRSLLIRDTERMLGGADTTVEHRGLDIMAELTFEEGQAYATTGVLPERVRLFSEAVRKARGTGGDAK